MKVWKCQVQIIYGSGDLRASLFKLPPLPNSAILYMEKVYTQKFNQDGP